jgi:hypothetical protein
MTEQLATETPVEPALTPPLADSPADPSPADPPSPQRRMVPEDVFVREITPLRSTLRQTENQLAEERRKNADLAALLERSQRNGNGTDPPSGQQPPASPRPPAGDPQADIDRRAAELVFQRDAQRVNEAGMKAYGQQPWADSVRLLESFNLNTGDFVSSIMEIAGHDRVHEVVHAIVTEPEKLASLASMSPARRIAEITRISMTANAKATETPQEPPKPPPARVVSRAPNPPPRVEPGGVKHVPKYDDSLSDEEFTAQCKETVKNRSAHR